MSYRSCGSCHRSNTWDMVATYFSAPFQPRFVSNANILENQCMGSAIQDHILSTPHVSEPQRFRSSGFMPQAMLTRTTISGSYARQMEGPRVPLAITEFEGQRIIAVILPCHNEGLTIAGVVDAFRRYLPSSTVYVYDNNSSDDTVREARGAGAVVRHEVLQGKGFVVRRALSQIDADVYV